MNARLAQIGIALLTASCGVLPPSDGWPVIFPGWADDPASEPEVVVDAPRAEAADPEREPTEAELGMDAPPPAGDAAAAAPDPPADADADPDPALEPEPEPPSEPPAEPPPLEAVPAPTLPSALVLGVPIATPDGNASLQLRDLFLGPEDGVARAVLVADGTGLERVLPARAFAWTVEDGPRLALPLAPVDARKLFAAEDMVELSGVVTALEEIGAASALKVRDEGNLLHRVVMPDAKLLADAFPALKVGVAVRLSAAPSRDDGGKVWIPASLTVGAETLELRTKEGTEHTKGICRGLVSARGLLGASLLLTDAEGTGTDWTFDPAAMQLISIDVVGGDKLATIPWTALTTSLR
jgi:hypothetical protein